MNEAGDGQKDGEDEKGGVGYLPIFLIAMLVLIGAGIDAVIRFRDDTPGLWQFAMDIWRLISTGGGAP